MRGFVSWRVPAGWLLGVVALVAAGLLIGKVAVLDAPPSGLVISASAPQMSPTPDVVHAAKPQTSIPGGAVLQIKLASTATAEPEKEATRVEGTVTEALPSPTVIPTATESAVVVYISGAVGTPGVYRLPAGSRVSDAVQTAGGMTTDADPNLINLAERVQDEEHIVVPRKGDTPVAPRPSPTVKPTATAKVSKPSPTKGTSSGGSSSAPPPGTKININSATEVQLEELPGIGPSLAARIISYRQEHGPFSAPEDIMHVTGIKEAIYARIRDYITVGP